MTIVTRPGINQTLQEAKREREKVRMQATAELAERRDGRDESTARLNREFQAGRRGRWRADTRNAAKEVAERVFGIDEEEPA